MPRTNARNPVLERERDFLAGLKAVVHLLYLSPGIAMAFIGLLKLREGSILENWRTVGWLLAAWGAFALYSRLYRKGQQAFYLLHRWDQSLLQREMEFRQNHYQ